MSEEIPMEIIDAADAPDTVWMHAFLDGKEVVCTRALVPEVEGVEGDGWIEARHWNDKLEWKLVNEVTVNRGRVFYRYYGRTMWKWEKK